MPHVSSSGDGGDELATEDEIKLYKHEGEEDNTENLTEDKSDLIDLTESEVRFAFSLLLFALKTAFFAYAIFICIQKYRRCRVLSACISRVLQEKVALAGGSYATTGKTSTRSDLSPVFGKFPLRNRSLLRLHSSFSAALKSLISSTRSRYRASLAPHPPGCHTAYSLHIFSAYDSWKRKKKTNRQDESLRRGIPREIPHISTRNFVSREFNYSLACLSLVTQPSSKRDRYADSSR